MAARRASCSTGSLVVSLQKVAAAIRLLAERHRVIAEGAGGASVAAALAGVPGARKIVCIVSGGNLDPAKLCSDPGWPGAVGQRVGGPAR